MKQRRAAREGLNEEFLDLDERFHLRIAEGAQLPILRAFLGQLGGFVRVATLGARRPPDALEQVVDEHERIVDAIEARDADAAVAALEDHLQSRRLLDHAGARGGFPMNRSEPYVLREVKVLDRSGSFSGPVDVHVEDGRVARIDRDLPAQGAASIDFSGLWLMPGVFDCHDHVTMSTVDMAEILRTPVTQWALEAAQNARVTLETGVTFVRDLCGRRPRVPGLDRGAVTCRGRGCRSPSCSSARPAATATATSAARASRASSDPRVIRGGRRSSSTGRSRCGTSCARNLRAGADWIKLAVTGGLVSEHDQPLIAELTPEEIARRRLRGRPRREGTWRRTPTGARG